MTKKKIKKSKKKLTPKPSNETLHIMAMIELTKRNITNDDSPLDLLFRGQLKKLESRLKEGV